MLHWRQRARAFEKEVKELRLFKRQMIDGHVSHAIANANSAPGSIAPTPTHAGGSGSGSGGSLTTALAHGGIEPPTVAVNLTASNGSDSSHTVTLQQLPPHLPPQPVLSMPLSARRGSGGAPAQSPSSVVSPRDMPVPFPTVATSAAVRSRFSLPAGPAYAVPNTSAISMGSDSARAMPARYGPTGTIIGSNNLQMHSSAALSWTPTAANSLFNLIDRTGLVVAPSVAASADDDLPLDQINDAAASTFVDAADSDADDSLNTSTSSAVAAALAAVSGADDTANLWAPSDPIISSRRSSLNALTALNGFSNGSAGAVGSGVGLPIETPSNGEVLPPQLVAASVLSLMKPASGNSPPPQTPPRVPPAPAAGARMSPPPVSPGTPSGETLLATTGSSPITTVPIGLARPRLSNPLVIVDDKVLQSSWLKDSILSNGHSSPRIPGPPPALPLPAATATATGSASTSPVAVGGVVNGQSVLPTSPSSSSLDTTSSSSKVVSRESSQTYLTATGLLGGPSNSTSPNLHASPHPPADPATYDLPSQQVS